jgi:Autotransporter beta-domain
MIKRIVIICFLFATGFSGMAQYNRERPAQINTYSGDDESFGNGFKREHLFIGGNLGLGFGSYSFNAGISPEIGYSFAQWLDAGVLVNLNYNSIRADVNYNNNTRQRSFNYGAGVFARVYPLSFLFLQAGTEYNWIDYNLKYIPTGESASYKTNALSLLAGIGYGQRIVGRNNFHIAIMIDLLNNPQSPYRDGNGVVLPIIKTGFDFYLHPRKQ